MVVAGSNDVEIIFWLSLLVSDFQKSVLQCSIHSCSLSLTKGTGGLQHHKVSIFDGKQHPKKNWFRGC